jgi:hypothetical protein
MNAVRSHGPSACRQLNMTKLLVAHRRRLFAPAGKDFRVQTNLSRHNRDQTNLSRDKMVQTNITPSRQKEDRGIRRTLLIGAVPGIPPSCALLCHGPFRSICTLGPVSPRQLSFLRLSSALRVVPPSSSLLVSWFRSPASMSSESARKRKDCGRRQVWATDGHPQSQKTNSEEV